MTGQNGTRAHVLLVDDEKTNARLIKMLLELDGFDVTACRNLREARGAASHADAFVVDYHLSLGELGVDLVQEVRGGLTEAKPETPVIITSGDHRQEHSAMDAGANLFILKPFPPGELAKALRSLLT